MSLHNEPAELDGQNSKKVSQDGPAEHQRLSSDNSSTVPVVGSGASKGRVQQNVSELTRESRRASELLTAPVEVLVDTLPPVSVVITGYERTKFLPEAIESVRAQNYSAPVEVIVIDDGSPTPLEESLAHCCPGVKWIRQTNQGVCAARDRGMREAGNEFVAHLDDDDLCDPQRLRIQSEFLLAHPEVDFVCCDLRHNNEEPSNPGFFRRKGLHQIESLRKECWSDGAWIYPRDVLIESFFRHLPFFPSTLMARRESALRIGSWNATARLSGDCHDFFIRANHFGTLAFLEQPLTILRRGHVEHLTSDPRKARIHEALQMSALLEEYPPELQQKVRPGLAQYLATRAHVCYHHGNKEVAGVLYRRAVRCAVGINLRRCKWMIAGSGLTLRNLLKGGRSERAIEAEFLQGRGSTTL